MPSTDPDQPFAPALHRSRGLRALCRHIAVALLATASLAAVAADPQVASFNDTPDPVPAGGEVSYAVRVENSGTDASLNTVLRVSVPAGAAFVGATPPGASCQYVAPNVVCALGTLAAGAAGTRNIDVVLRALGPGPDTLNLAATVSADNDENPGNNTQTQTTTVISGANLALAKSGSPNPVVGGSNLSYTLNASNAGPNASAGIRIVDNLPPSTTFVSASGSGWSCTHAAGVVSCTRAGPHAAGAPIPPVTLVAAVNASGGTITNSASVEPFVVGGVPIVADPVPNNNTATADTTVLPGADVRIAQKTVTSGLPAVAGSNVGFRIEPRNSGPAAGTDVVVTDVLPTGWTFVSASGPNWSCSAAGQTVTCSRATLPMGATDNIALVATAPDNAQVGPTGSSYTNTASIAASSNDPNPGNNSGSVTVNVLPDGADLRITKAKVPDPVAQGSPLRSTLRALNNGPRVATGPLRVVDVLPPGETFVAASGGGWSCSVAGQVVTCTHPNAAGLAVGAALPSITIDSIAGTAGTLTNTACTGGSVPAGSGATPSPPAEGDPNPTNDCVSVGSSSTTTQPDLGITKTTSTPSGGDKLVSSSESSVTYTLVVTNHSVAPATDAATGVRIVDTVPAFLVGRTPAPTAAVVVSAGSTATFNCTTSNATVTCTQSGGSLGPGATATVTITVQRPLQSGGPFTNTATVSNTVEGDPNPANNSASDTVTIEPIADVQMSGKTVTPNPVRAGENATYVLSFRNNGPSAAAGVVVTDALSLGAGDPGVTVVSITSSKSGSSCSIAAGAQLTPGANSYSCTIGTLANGETQTITLVVRPDFQAGNPVRTIGNTAAITTTTPESPGGGDNGNNSASAALTVNGAALDLLVNKTDAVDPIAFVGGSAFIDYRVRVTNNGPSFGTNVRVAESMLPPAGKRIRYVCDTSSYGGASCNPTSLCSVAPGTTSAPGTALVFSCQVPAGSVATGAAVGTLAASASKDLFLRFEALDPPEPTGDLFRNMAAVAANEPDTFPANNEATEQSTVRQVLDLQAAKTATPATLTLNQPFDWTVTVTNAGPANSLQTIVTDTLPAGVTLTGAATYSKTAPAGTGTCTQAAATLTCTMGPLNNGGIATVTIPARFTALPSGGSATNTATIGTNPNDTGAIDSNPANNSASSTVTITQSSLAGMVFRDRDANGQPGGPGENGIGSVALTLTGTDAYGNAIARSTTTAANGSYRFDALPPADAGGYTIRQTQPAGYVDGPNPAPGTADSLGGTRPASGAPDFGRVIAAIPVGGNVAGINYDFPEIARPAIGGTVYRDHDNNGLQGAGEAGIAGATVQLYRSSDHSLAATLSTDASGNYLFSNLEPGSYDLAELQPAGYLDGIAAAGQIGGAPCAGCSVSRDYDPANEPATISRIRGLNLANGDSATAMNFGELVPSTLAGAVYIDFNANGLLDSGEPGIAGVTLTLAGSDDRGNPVSRSLTTNAAGSYAFGGLRPAAAGGYTITQTQPAGFSNGPNPPPGSADSLGGTRPASGAPGFGTLITAIPVAANQNGVQYRFGELGGTLLAGTVFIDRNRDGTLQPDEPGRAAGVTVQLVDPVSGTVIATTTTDASGNYLFNNAPVGNFRVVMQPPAGYGTTSPTTLDVNVPPTGLSGQNFGLSAGALTGKVFLDADNSGTQQPGEPGIAGVPIELVNALTSAVIATVTTDATGAYRFDDLIAGSYTLRQPTQPPGTINGQTIAGSAGGSATPVATVPSAIAAITLPAAAVATGNDFAELMPASLAGSVYNDTNNNGVREPGESGFAGNPLQLGGTDDLGQAVSLSTSTDADGRYRFAVLRPGTYTVTQPLQPPGSLNGITTPGSSGGTATAVSVTPSAISAIVLPSATAATAYDFGELGDSPDVVVAKQALGGFSTGNPGSYRISVANIGQLPTSGSYTVQDRLPPGIVLAAAPAGTGWSCTGAAGASEFSCSSSAVIAAGATAAASITLPVNVLATALPGGSDSVVLDNAVLVSGGGETAAFQPSAAELANFNGNPGALPDCGAAPTHNACRTPTTVRRAASVSGTVWYETGAVPRQLDGGDTRLAGWSVEVLDPQGGNVVRSTTTGADGNWRVGDLPPGQEWLLRFREPGSGVVWGVPVSGNTGTPPVPCVTSNPGQTQRSSCIESSQHSQLRIVLQPGDNLVQQSLPVDPSGVVYDAITRQPVPGSVVTLAPAGSCPGYDPATHIVDALLGGYTVSGSGIAMTVGALGAYQFHFATTAPASCAFTLTVTPPASHSFVSQVIPPQAGPLATPPGPGSLLVQPQVGPPPVGQSTTYYLGLNAGSGTQHVLNNHIPLDPRALTGIVIVKTGSTQLVELGDSLQYSVRVRNTSTLALGALFVDDALPAGFRYIPGTAAVTHGVTRTPLADPTGSPGPKLVFSVGALGASDELVLTYRVRVGVGAAEGDGVNTAQAKPTPTTNCRTDPGRCSNQAQFRVRVHGGVFTTDACLAGKVFVDCNGNHVQDEEELGVPGVRLWLQDGTYFITDSEGKYSYCGLRPMLHVLKVDPRTLPEGSRLTESSNRNVGDPGSLMLDLKKGELHRGDFIEGSCSNRVLDQVKARRALGEVGGPQTERQPAGPLQFRGRAPGAPRGATTSADQTVPQPRGGAADAPR